MARLIHLPLPPLRPIARPERALGRRADPPTRSGASGTVGTMLLATIAALSVTLLGGCGGGEAGDDTRAEAGESATVSATVSATNATTSSTTPHGPSELAMKAEASGAAARQVAVDFRLESDYGPGDAPGGTKYEVADASPERGHRGAVPVDRQAQTRAGRYLSRAVAERLYEETGGRAVWVDAGCCAGHDPELPERIAFGMQAVLGDEAPLYISGSDLRQAARLADRLDALGVGRVYLVTP